MKCKHSTHKRYDVCRLGHQSVGKLLVELDQVTDVDIAVVFLEESVLLQLVSIPIA